MLSFGWMETEQPPCIRLQLNCNKMLPLLVLAWRWELLPDLDRGTERLVSPSRELDAAFWPRAMNSSGGCCVILLLEPRELDSGLFLSITGACSAFVGEIKCVLKIFVNVKVLG